MGKGVAVKGGGEVKSDSFGKGRDTQSTVTTYPKRGVTEGGDQARFTLSSTPEEGVSCCETEGGGEKAQLFLYHLAGQTETLHGAGKIEEKT